MLRLQITPPATEGGGSVLLQPGASPFARGLASRIALKLASDSLFAASTNAMSGHCRVASAKDPRRADLILGDGLVQVREAGVEPPDLGVVVGFAGGLCPETGEPTITGNERRGDLAAWVLSLLYEPGMGWAEAADEFWAIAGGRRGSPAGLRVHCTDQDEVREFGEGDDDCYEIHGPARTLARVLTGTLPLPEAAGLGGVHISGSYRQLSVLAGCCYDLLYGEVRDLD